MKIEDAPKGCIRSYSGLYVDVFNPKPEMFCIEDIAHALSMIPRFGGHANVRYSVADHCINGVLHMKFNKESRKDRYDFLMHDCSEAYLLDIPTPIKCKLIGYKNLEHSLMMCLSGVFKFGYILSEVVKKYDKSMLDFEWNDLMIYSNWSPITEKESEMLFLKLYKELCPKKSI